MDTVDAEVCQIEDMQEPDDDPVSGAIVTTRDCIYTCPRCALGQS